jgi:hypothetical protein
MDKEQVRALWTIRAHWHDLYVINFVDGIWSANRPDTPARILTARSAADLRMKLQNDHADTSTE